MIDIKKAQEEFLKYVSHYDQNMKMIQNKINHTLNVVKFSEKIAKSLNLSEQDIELAKLIALLHDIARFHQATIYNDYNNIQVYDHGDAAIILLKKNNFIRTFIKEDIYDNIIYKAIKNHNKLKIEDGLLESELMHAKIIRDADKTDNFRMKTFERFEDMYKVSKEETENSTISDRIYNNIINNQSIDIKDRTTPMDYWITIFSFICDYNFPIGLKYIKEHNYINILIDRLDYKNPITKDRMETIRNHTLKYIDERINYLENKY